jgi:hypothetical protein
VIVPPSPSGPPRVPTRAPLETDAAGQSPPSAGPPDVPPIAPDPSPRSPLEAAARSRTALGLRWGRRRPPDARWPRWLDRLCIGFARSRDAHGEYHADETSQEKPSCQHADARCPAGIIDPGSKAPPAAHPTARNPDESAATAAPDPPSRDPDESRPRPGTALEPGRRRAAVWTTGAVRTTVRTTGAVWTAGLGLRIRRRGGTESDGQCRTDQSTQEGSP